MRAPFYVCMFESTYGFTVTNIVGNSIPQLSAAEYAKLSVTILRCLPVSK